MTNNPSFSIYNASAGSGKTYTLVKEYLKIILRAQSDDAYRNILAITFTNKAVHEMKSRIVESLTDFCSDEPSPKTLDLIDKISEEIGLSADAIKKKSRSIIKHLIHNYAAFDISTIDKFTHRVIRTFARDLDLPPTFEVSLDTDNLLTEAVDALIARAGTDDVLTKLLVDFTMEKTDDDKSWDISREIQETGKLALNENNRNEIVHFKDKDIQAFVMLKNQIREVCNNMESECQEFATQALQLINSNGIDYTSFYRSSIPNHFLNIQSGVISKSTDKLKYLSEEEGKRYPARASAIHKQLIDSIANELTFKLTSINALAEKHLLYSAFLKNITPLSLLSTVTHELANIQQEQNILSIAEFNSIINRELQNQPAPFIYERLGEKYRHFFIDEFQDTSEMQWQNLIPLIHNSLSGMDEFGTKGTLMIVGDPKQSIYRWRGGKAEQFIGLGKDQNPFGNNSKENFNLETNWRSYSNVINFNNEFFKEISAEFDHIDYTDLYANQSFQKFNSKLGGYVNMRFVNKEEITDDISVIDLHLSEILPIIQGLLQKGFEYSDIAILVRKRSQGVAIANHLTEHKIPLLSSETLMIQNASDVQFIINLLHYINNSNNRTAKAKFLQYLASEIQSDYETHDFISVGLNIIDERKLEEWLKSHYDDSFSFSFADIRKKSLYETVEIISSQFLNGSTNAYVQYFLDIVLDRDVKNQAGISDFLNFWDENSDKYSIPSPENSNAVKIMTIHKSKGLEFPVVIFPFAEEDYSRGPNEKMWLDGNDEIGLPRLLVDKNSSVESYGDVHSDVYLQKKQEDLLDNINVLYVALTRAEEQLFIVSGMNINANGNLPSNMSSLFIKFLKSKELFNEDQFEYDFGDATKLSNARKAASPPTAIQNVTNVWDFKNIKIAQRESLMWGTQQLEAIDYGNLVHEIMAMIETSDEVQTAIDQALESGLLRVDQVNAISQSITQIINHPELEDFFKSGIKVLNERSIIPQSGSTLKPDRVVITSSREALLLDYKTGALMPNHVRQVQSYADAIEEIGYNVRKKVLVYLGSEVKVVNL